MRNKTLFLLTILSLLFATAQSPAKSDIQNIESLLDSAHAKIAVVDMKGSALFARKALEISREKGYLSGEAWGNFFIGQALFELGAYKDALLYLKKSETLNKSLENHYLFFEIYRVRGRVFGSMELLDKAIAEQEKGLALIPQITKPQNQKDFLTGLAYENLAVSYSKTGDKNSFYSYLRKNERLLEKQDPSVTYVNLITLYTLFGVYYADENQFDKSESYFIKARDTAEKYNYPYISFTYKHWGDLEMARKKPQSALQYYEKSLEILNNTNFQNEIPEVYKKIALVYEQLGDQQKAKDLKLKALELEDSLKTEKLRASSLAVDEIMKAEAEKETNKFSKRQLVSWGVLSLVLVLLFILLIKYQRTRKSKVMIEEKEAELRNKEKEISKLHQKVNEAFEEVTKLAKSNSPEFFIRFREVYPEVVAKLLEINPKLTLPELTLCGYIFLGFNTKDIMNITFTSINTVKSRKYHLRKKLNISAEESTEMWFKNLKD